ncbi:hypothetical protein Taro_026366 [Colocasia esculenta]|uniref:tRNA (guanine-N(7)-)-methyltransferase non-catalytic subunit n=1 Tax=Colocasia esculenta TaxID=4460 RepID=A0A843VF13_COLES|nr:hypothetical protein [Colocasia esculenta]
MEEAAAGMEEGEQSQEAEVSPALIAVHPLGKSVVVAVGSELRAYDLDGDKAISLSDNSSGPSHSEDIKAIGFGAKGKLFASAGNDKLVKVWATDSWNCMRTVCSEKRVSAVAISPDGLFVSFADKFGVVYILSLDEKGAEASADKKAVPLLGHYCSIITSLEFSPDGQFIASADRDFKIRITVFPKRPLSGAHEIQSFCLGHTDFVLCLAFICSSDGCQAFLLSGGGDSTVRLWDFMSGSLLDTCEVGLKVVSIGGHFVPTSLGMSSTADHLWMVMGASNLPSHGSSLPLACVKVISPLQKIKLDEEHSNLTVLDDEEVPGGQKLLEKLQGRLNVAEDHEALEVAAEALKTAMRNLLVKRQYSVANRELRKKIRNDRKIKQQHQ